MTDLAFPADVELTTTSLTLPEKTARRDWDGVGVRLVTMEQAVMWWIGDWWRFGERAYGELASQAAPTGYNGETVRHAARVADRIESGRRRPDLSFGHHQNVAPLPPEEQDYWLSEAEGGQWTVMEMRAHIRRGHTNGEDPPTEDENETWQTLQESMAGLSTLLERDPAATASAVPNRRRAATARRLRKLGMGLARIAWTLEEIGEERDDQSIPA